MRRSKDIFSDCFHELIIDDEKLRNMQLRLLDALSDVHNICEKYNLQYFLSGGTLLGAIRHKGFIPWDDDIDIMMPLTDYNKLGELVAQEFGDKYLVKYPRTDTLDPTPCLKIYLKNTIYKEILSSEWNKPQMLFIDVFAIRSVSKYKFARRVKGKIFDIALHCAGLKAELKYPSTSLKVKSKTNKELKEYLNKRKILSYLANLIPMKLWFFIANFLLKKQYDSNLTIIPEGIRYNRELLPACVYESSVDVEFEGKIFKAPVGWKTYLENLYGDYMQVPPINQRERHIAVHIDF